MASGIDIASELASLATVIAAKFTGESGQEYIVDTAIDRRLSAAHARLKEYFGLSGKDSEIIVSDSPQVFARGKKGEACAILCSFEKAKNVTD